jgi:hypothetical protein
MVEAIKKHLKVPLNHDKSISPKSIMSHDLGEYELIYHHKLNVRRLIVRYTVSDDIKNA